MDTILSITGGALVVAGLLTGPAVIQAADAAAQQQDTIATCVQHGEYGAAVASLGLHATVWNVEHGLTTVTDADLATMCPEVTR